MTTDLYRPTALSEAGLTLAEARALEGLRLRYGQDHDLFSERELAHLCFLRWCIARGHVGEEKKALLGGL